MDDNITYGVFWKSTNYRDDEWHPFMTWLSSYEDAHENASEAAENPSALEVKIVERVETYTDVVTIINPIQDAKTLKPCPHCGAKMKGGAK